MLEAELELTAGRFPEARKALGDLAESAPSARACAIMAAIEKGQGASEAVVRGWLAKALTASRGAQWCCDNCGFIAPDFSPLCPNCEAFDTLTWRDVGADGGEHASSVAMTPLLVGEEPEEDADEEEPDVAETEAEAEMAAEPEHEPESGPEPAREPEAEGVADASDEPETEAAEAPAAPAKDAGDEEAERKLEQAAAAAREAAG